MYLKTCDTMDVTLRQIANNLNHNTTLTPDRRIDVLLTDSRSLSDAEHTLFFALRTPQNDGHRYVRRLYDAGVRAFVVSEAPDISVMPDADFLLVDDTLSALQTVARSHRERFSDVEVVGVTGSRGKTIVKEWLYQTLSGDFRITRSPRSYNSQTGVPLSVWQLSDETQLAIFEAGVSQQGEMSRLQAVIQPTIGVMTSLGHDHDAGFVSLEEKCREKARLFINARAVVYGGDDPIVDSVIREMLPAAVRYVWSETDSNATVYVVSRVSTDRKSTSLSLIINGDRFDTLLPFSAAHLVDDALTVLTAQIALGVSSGKAVASLETLTGVATRLSVIEGVNHCLLVFDQNRSSDYHALSTAMDFVAPRLTPGLSLTVIIGDMAHETMSEQELYSAVGRLLLSRGAGRVIGCGTELMRNIGAFSAMDTQFYSSADEMISGLSTSDFNDQLVLISGSSNDHFERLLPMLEARSHETVLEVNLDALVHNFNYFRSKLQPSTGIICMVKASGYGAGSYELAKTLQAQGASYLAVAVVDEGVELRQRGITMPVMVMNPKVTNYPVLFENHLEPEIYSLEILREIIAEGIRYGVTDYPVHIKIDSGMRRLGFTIEEMPDVVDMLRGQNVVVPSSVFSHLAAADMPAEDDYTMAQFDYFDRCAQMLMSAFPEVNIKRHILNSTGILRFPERQYDMVRLGIGLYGVPTIPGDPQQSALQPVSSLRTVIISVKQWPAGTTVGYSRRGVLSRDSRIATLPIGYADGLDRQLGYGNASFVIRGQRCPTVGSICMDLCMVDVTECQDAAVGDSVEIFGREVTAVELGDILDTIPYEVLTSVSQRVKRVYYRE